MARRHLWDLLFELSGRGVTLFVTTHYMDEAERCTDVGYIFMSKLLVLGKPAELKALPDVTPEQTRRYELQIPNATEHLAELRTVDGVRDATLFGETVHVLVDEQLSPQQMLEKIGVAEHDIDYREISPSLEDVFVTLTSNAEAKARDQTPTELTETHSSPAKKISTQRPAPRQSGSLAGLWAVLVKEFYHIRRQPSTLFFMLLVPVHADDYFRLRDRYPNRTHSHRAVRSRRSTVRARVCRGHGEHPSF